MERRKIKDARLGDSGLWNFKRKNWAQKKPGFTLREPQCTASGFFISFDEFLQNRVQFRCQLCFWNRSY